MTEIRRKRGNGGRRREENRKGEGRKGGMKEDMNRMGRKMRRWKKRKKVEGGEGGAGFQSFLQRYPFEGLSSKNKVSFWTLITKVFFQYCLPKESYFDI